MFDFEKLEVYQLGIGFVNKVINLTKNLPTDLRFSIGEHLIKTAISIPNNIAEGSGKKSKKAKSQYYGYALDSARECIPMVTILYEQKRFCEEENKVLRGKILEICNKIAKLISSIR